MIKTPDLENIELLDRFETHLEASALASVTVVNYLADLRAFVRWLSELQGSSNHLWSVSAGEVRAYLAYLRRVKRYAPSTINRHLQSLRKFYAYAMEQGWVAANPAKKLKLLPAGQEARPMLLETDEIGALLLAARRSAGPHATRDDAVLRLMLNAGLKVGELIQLTLDDVDRVGTAAYVYPCRTASPRRRVPLSPETWAAIERYLVERPAGGESRHLFLSSEGLPMSVRAVQRLVAAHAQAAGLDGVTPQTLRYAYAHSLMLQTGDLALVMERLGHKNLAITARYLRPRSRRHQPPAYSKQS